MEPTTEPATGNSEKDALLDRMQSLASALVSFAWEKFRLRLDYSDASITQVEGILDKLQIDFARKGPDSKAKIHRLSSYFGAFIGEVIRRKHGGVWTAEIPDVSPPTNGVEVTGLIFAPSRNAYLRLTEGPAFSVKVLSRKFEEAVSQRRAVRDETPIDAKRVRELVRNYAVQAVQDARKKFDFELDYTETSLDAVEGRKSAQLWRLSRRNHLQEPGWRLARHNSGQRDSKNRCGKRRNVVRSLGVYPCRN